MKLRSLPRFLERKYLWGLYF